MDSCKKEYFTIIKGEERTLPLQFTKPDGSPYSLNTPSEIILKFKKQDKTILQKKLSLSEVTVLNDTLGKVTVILQEADTALLMEGERMDIGADITNGTTTRKAIFKGALTVVKDFS